MPEYVGNAGIRDWPGPEGPEAKEDHERSSISVR